MSNYYTHGRLAQAHRRDLLREAEHERLVAQLPRPRYNFLLLAQLVLPWRALRTRLRKRLQRRIA